MTRKEAQEPGSSIANLEKAAKQGAEAFDAGLVQLAQKPDSEKPTMGGKQRERTREEQRAEIERVAREHGPDRNEEGFNEALKRLAKGPAR